jgi:hypothetical protein
MVEDDPVEVPITGELDLHAFAPRDLPSLVEEYVRVCGERGILRLRLVHGRGTGTQRAVVRRVLATLPAVARFDDAPPASGGWAPRSWSCTPGSDGVARVSEITNTRMLKRFLRAAGTRHGRGFQRHATLWPAPDAMINDLDRAEPGH